MKKFEENLKKKFDKSVHFNHSLKNYNWFNLGGPAEIFFKPNNKDQLSEFLKIIHKEQIPIFTLGAGSNILIRDKGIKGVTIKLGKEFSFLEKIDDENINIGGNVQDKKISDFATLNSIAGLEYLSCVPGTVGGSTIMNSGCYGNEICENIVSINAMDFSGNEITLKNKEIKFSYRNSDISNLIITSVKLKGKKSKKDEIKKKQLNLISKKKLSQPNRIKTCGSTFKNSGNYKAWELIKKTNSHLFKVGNASISDKHCNFFINEGNATSMEIENLIDKVKSNVKKQTGILMDLEIKMIGEKI